ncbi:MAG: hypothetical protein V1663_04785 [archaeon]
MKIKDHLGVLIKKTCLHFDVYEHVNTINILCDNIEGEYQRPLEPYERYVIRINAESLHLDRPLNEQMGIAQRMLTETLPQKVEENLRYYDQTFNAFRVRYAN